MELFLHGLGETVQRLQDEVVRVEVGGVGTKLRPMTSTSVSVGDTWWEERFFMTLYLNFFWSSFRIWCWVFLKFLVVRVCGKSFVNEGMEYGHLGCAVLANFSEPSLQFLWMDA